MAYLTDFQVDAIRSHMTGEKELLLKKFRAKNSPYDKISVPIGEMSAYETLGFKVDDTTKKKAKMSRRKNASKEFEDDIWCMFYKLGFRILNTDEHLEVQWGPNPQDTHQLDVVAVGDDAIFVVECKAAEEWKTRSFKDDIDVMSKYQEGVTRALRQIYCAEKRVKFIFATRKCRVQQAGNDIERLKAHGIYYLNDNTYDYISNLIVSYKDSVIYQFHGLMFKDELINKERICIPALQGLMGTQKYYLFSIEPSTLLKIGFVLHRTRVNDSMAPTYQRLLVPSRLKGISKFIDGGGYFPNSIIINFSASQENLKTEFKPLGNTLDSKAKFGMLSIPNAYGIAYIIDGQHRVYGYASSKQKDNNTIPVVAFENMPSEEQLKIFMEINENQKAVKPSLRLDLEEDLYWSSGRLDSRMKALRSSIIKALAADSNNVLYNKISVGEDSAQLQFKPFNTAFSKSGLIPSASQSHWTGDTDSCIYDIEETDADKAMKDSRRRITQFVNNVYEILEERLEKEKHVDYLFSNRATFAIITIIGSLHSFLIGIGAINKRSSISERTAAIKPYIEELANALNALSDEESASLKGALGQGADTYWLRIYQTLVNKAYPDYNPEELVLFKETQDESIQKEGQELKDGIRNTVKELIFTFLANIHGEKWENSILSIRHECEGRIIKSIDEHESIEDYDWKDWLEVSDLKAIIEKNFSDESFASAFSINVGDAFKTKKEKLAWLSKIDQPKGKKPAALTRNDINKLWLINDHLSNFVES